jgi:hypothetical protein
MLPLILALLAAVSVFFRSRVDIALEVLALPGSRSQYSSANDLAQRCPGWIVSSWIVLRQVWSKWTAALAIVKPETVVGWHRAGFHLYWRWRSRPGGGRPKVSEEVRTLIRRMAAENSGWGAPKIHGELQKLGFEVSE